MGREENFRCLAVLLVPMSRLLVILTLLAAAFPAAAGAQSPASRPSPSPAPPTRSPRRPPTSTARVDPNGTATTYHFEYGTSAGYGLVTPEADAGAGTDPAAVQAAIASLTRNTTYHYRLVATQAPCRVLRGADRTFRTATGRRSRRASRPPARARSSRAARC